MLFRSVGVVALDGTKVKANASLSANRTQEHIEAEVRKMLAEAKEKDEEEDQLFGKDSRGDEIPEELKDRLSPKSSDVSTPRMGSGISSSQIKLIVPLPRILKRIVATSKLLYLSISIRYFLMVILLFNSYLRSKFTGKDSSGGSGIHKHPHFLLGLHPL